MVAITRERKKQICLPVVFLSDRLINFIPNSEKGFGRIGRSVVPRPIRPSLSGGPGWFTGSFQVVSHQHCRRIAQSAWRRAQSDHRFSIPRFTDGQLNR